MRGEEPNYKRSPHNANSLSNDSTSNFTDVDTARPRGGSLVTPEAHPEQRRNALETITPVLSSGSPPFPYPQQETQQSVLEMFNLEYPENTSIDWSGGLSDTTQIMFGADATANSIDWIACELDALSAYDQAKNFDWSGSPMLPRIHDMELPEVGDFFDTSAQVSERGTNISLLDPFVPGGLNTRASFSETAHLDDQLDTINGQDGSTHRP